MGGGRLHARCGRSHAWSLRGKEGVRGEGIYPCLFVLWILVCGAWSGLEERLGGLGGRYGALLERGRFGRVWITHWGVGRSVLGSVGL